jgi:hypothetical protein
MCGSVSAIGLADHERELWPYVRERLRAPGRLMALMRGLLGDAEVAAVVAVTPKGAVTPVAILVTTEQIEREIHSIAERGGAGGTDVRFAKIGEYDIEVLVREVLTGPPQPLAVLNTPWIEQHLLLFARVLWRRRQGTRSLI